MDRELGGEGDFLYWGGRNFVTAVAWAVGLRDDGEDFEFGSREEMLEGRDGELGRATEE